MTSSASDVIVIDPIDSVGVARAALRPGDVVRAGDAGEVVVRSRIPRGHKVALCDLSPGEPVLKYGAQIGVATVPITRGDHVHLHNLVTVRGRQSERPPEVNPGD
jgi:altronate hydrolase